MSGPPVHPDDPLLLACRRIGRAMDLFDEAACRVLGIGRSDLRALNLLEHGPLGAAQLAGGLGLTRASVTALVDRLEAAGYVAREPHPADRRVVHVALRPSTYQAFARVYRPLGRQVYAATDGLSDRDRHAVAAALEAMGEAFDAARATLTRLPDPD